MEQKINKSTNIELNTNTAIDGYTVLPAVHFDLFGEEINEIKSFKERFPILPFSVINTGENKWRQRKIKWNKLIGDSGESREMTFTRGTGKKSSDNFAKKVSYGGYDSFGNTVSILDACLAELVIDWYSLKNWKCFDPFAGDSIFGFVAGVKNRVFTGIELRKEQAELNQKRLLDNRLSGVYICDDGININNHIANESQDFMFSCPPYFDLEVYSDLPNDASNQKNYQAYIEIMNKILTNSIKCLKENRFCVIVIGDVRDKKTGFYYSLESDIIKIMQSNNIGLYQELIIQTPIGTKAFAANNIWQFRKIGKIHEKVLIFYKGNQKEIKNIFK